MTQPRNELGAQFDAGGTMSEAEERFENARHRLGMYLAPVAFFGVYFLASGLKYEGRALSAVLAAVAVLWLTETIPLAATALLGAALCIVMGVAPAKVVLAPFADPIIFLFLGSFMLVEAMMVHGLDRRIALAVLATRWVGGRPLRFFLALGGVTTFLSMWVSNTATCAMMLPIGLGVLNAWASMRAGAVRDRTILEETRRAKPHAAEGGSSGHVLDYERQGAVGRWPYATGLMLMVAYAASVGGVGTPIGSPPNLICIAQLRDFAGKRISFFEWLAVGVPLVVVMFGVVAVVLRYFHPPDRTAAGAGEAMGDYVRRQRDSLGPMTRGEINTLVIFLLAIFAWVFPGLLGLFVDEDQKLAPGEQLTGVAALAKLLNARMPEAGVALCAAALLFLTPVNFRKNEYTLNWSQATRIDWGTILLFGGGLSLGGLMFSTGVADVIGRSAVGLLGAKSIWALTAAAIAISIVLTETTSNTAAAGMLAPVLIALTKEVGVNPIPPVLGVCFGCSLGFMLPVGTPPNAIAYSSGLVPLPQMVRAGVLVDLIGGVAIFAVLRVVCPMLGWA